MEVDRGKVVSREREVERRHLRLCVEEYTITNWSYKRRHETWSDTQETKGLSACESEKCVSGEDGTWSLEL